jgi:hypothetical protein
VDHLGQNKSVLGTCVLVVMPIIAVGAAHAAHRHSGRVRLARKECRSAWNAEISFPDPKDIMEDGNVAKLMMNGYQI